MKTNTGTIFLKEYQGHRNALYDMVNPEVLALVEQKEINQKYLSSFLVRSNHGSVIEVFKFLEDVDPEEDVSDVFLFEIRKRIPKFFLPQYLCVRKNLLECVEGIQSLNSFESYGIDFQHLVIKHRNTEGFFELIQFLYDFKPDSLEYIIETFSREHILETFSPAFVTQFLKIAENRIYLLSWLSKFEKFDFDSQEMIMVLNFLIHLFSLSAICEKISKTEYEVILSFLKQLNGNIQETLEDLDYFKQCCQRLNLSFTRKGLICAMRTNHGLVIKTMIEQS